jgi:uncharacterized protein (TIGR02246 family)
MRRGATVACMTLAESLRRHLDAIAARDLDALAATIADDDVVLVTADGEIARGHEEFLDRHRGWFASPTWRLETQTIHVREAGDLATVLLALRYRDRTALDERSILSLVFRRDGDRWLMVQDQNTPVRGSRLVADPEDDTVAS